MDQETVWHLTQDGASFIGIVLTLGALILGYFDWRLNQRPPSWWEGKFEKFQTEIHEEIADYWLYIHRGNPDAIPYFDTMTLDEISRIRAFLPKDTDQEEDMIDFVAIASEKLEVEANFDKLKAAGKMLDQLALANSNWERFRDENKEQSFLRPMIVLVVALLFQLYGAYPDRFWEVSSGLASPEISETKR